MEAYFNVFFNFKTPVHCTYFFFPSGEEMFFHSASTDFIAAFARVT
jgi:hypothetical protein